MHVMSPKQSSLTAKMKRFGLTRNHMHITQIAWTKPVSWASLGSEQHGLSSTSSINDVCLLIFTLPNPEVPRTPVMHNTQLQHDACALVEHVGAHAPGATLASAWLAKDPRHEWLPRMYIPDDFQSADAPPTEWFPFTYGAFQFRKLPQDEVFCMKCAI